MKLKTFFLCFGILGFVFMVNAQGLTQNSTPQAISAYRFYKDVDGLSVNVPTVVEIPFFEEFIERYDFVVLDKNLNTFEPYFFKQETVIDEVPLAVSSEPHADNTQLMNDRDIRTYVDFPLPDNAQGQVKITLTSSAAITSSAITTLLANNVALPSFVEIRAMINGQNRIIVANRRMDQQTIHFPQTVSNKWTITFIFGQPLRISEIKLIQDYATKSNTQAIRFLAQPAHAYRIYYDSDRSMTTQVGEAGNLSSAKDVIVFSSASINNNPNYIIADIDNDGVPDISDNCVSVANSDQLDVNNNNRGDSCDDFDQDGIINSDDNCADNPNRNQKDTDSDGIGDVCDKEESRITERYTWIPWVGMGSAALVLILLLALTAKSIYTTKK